MRIAELYQSVQGEGLLTGTPSIFVRTSGCNLRCWFCDTPYTSWEPEGEERSVADVLAQTLGFDCRHVVITGGEPMLFAEMIPLCRELRRRGRHITIETAGTLYLPAACDLMSVSPKLSSSGPDPERHAHWARRHERQRLQREVLMRLMAEYEYQLKFVVDRIDDVAEVEKMLATLPAVSADRVLLMPQGRTMEEMASRSLWLAELCHERGWALCPRRQLEWFGPVRGT